MSGGTLISTIESESVRSGSLDGKQKSPAMKIALGIFRVLPAGGLERHALKLAQVLVARGHHVTLHTTAGTETAPPGIETVTLARAGWTNHAALEAFSAGFAAATSSGFDVIVGFQKFRKLDVLFCADWCFLDRPRPLWQRLLPRYRTMASLERACFGPEAKTRIIALASPQLEAYVRAYATPPSRLAVLPPTVEPSWRPSVAPAPEQRAALRAKYGLDERAVTWLWVGLQPRVKGLDRAIAALASQPDARLLVCGAEKSSRQVSALLADASRSGLAERIRVFGMVPDSRVLGELFAAADLLVHPARLDVTGTVILEAIVSGLPVITTENCGYSLHVKAADGGIVLPVPFDPASLDRALAAADAPRRAVWSRNCLTYGSRPALYSGFARAADLIEAAAQSDDRSWNSAGGLNDPRPQAPDRSH
jgi:UDP-glucose:(heptosyl)LPS alpha-1,3-glucosyltransferase